jgi:hypothetical protein
MAFWGKVWATACDCYQLAAVTTLLNITSPDQNSNTPTVLLDTPIHAVSLSEAMGYWIDQLRRRLAAQVIVTNTGETVYNITLKRGNRVDRTTWSWYNSTGRYPVTCTYSTPHASSSSTQFYNVGQMLDYLVDKLA